MERLTGSIPAADLLLAIPASGFEGFLYQVTQAQAGVESYGQRGRHWVRRQTYGTTH